MKKYNILKLLNNECTLLLKIVSTTHLEYVRAINKRPKST